MGDLVCSAAATAAADAVCDEASDTDVCLCGDVRESSDTGGCLFGDRCPAGRVGEVEHDRCVREVAAVLFGWREVRALMPGRGIDCRAVTCVFEKTLTA